MRKQISKLEKKIIKEIQGELPLVKKPFKQIAQNLNITESKLIKKLKKLKSEGKLRRIGGIIYHRKAGFEFNGMVVWEVPKNKREQAGKIMATYPEISHVFERPTYEDWPYSLFSMVHAQNKNEVEKVVKDIQNKIEVKNYKILYSTEELKKVSMKYFCLD